MNREPMRRLMLHIPAEVFSHAQHLAALARPGELMADCLPAALRLFRDPSNREIDTRPCEPALALAFLLTVASRLDVISNGDAYGDRYGRAWARDAANTNRPGGKRSSRPRSRGSRRPKPRLVVS